MNRRETISVLGTMALLLSGFARKANPTILIINGWQAVNIGDITHVPGLLSFLKKYVPHAKVLLWTKNFKGYGVEAMLMKDFPGLKILEEGYTEEVYKRNFPEIMQADLLMHGSGSGIVAPDPIQWWTRDVKKPYGFFGITLPSYYDQAEPLLNGASFVFTREQVSKRLMLEHGITAPVMFVPDSTFNIALAAADKAKRFQADHALQEKKFICVVPRLRYTPYHKFASVTWSSERIAEVESVNNKFAHVDHDKLCGVIERWVRTTDNKVVICPEMEYQVALMKELIFDRLPADIREKVSMHPYWLPDEAASFYKDAFAVVSLECHSPIIALANGTAAFYLRQKEDTHKGEMYNDLQLGDWMFSLDTCRAEDVAEKLLQLYKQPTKAKEKIQRAYAIVRAQNEIAHKTIKKFL